MQMKKSAQPIRIEARWPGVLAVLVVLLLAAILPERISLFPAWLPYVLGVAVLTPMVGAGLTAGKGRWERLEHTITILFFLVVVAGTLANLANLMNAMVRRPAEVSGMQLLASSIGVWVTNVIAFSLLYWQLDRGGPGGREIREKKKPDWLFPQEGAPAEDVPPDWQPTFVDYLFLGFSTATASSPTDALPLTSRAKILMMLESSISLMTIVMVASRAINILGS
jgi:hypothetical protein